WLLPAPATREIYTLSLHDALPIFAAHADALVGDGDHEPAAVDAAAGDDDPGVVRGERHGVLDQLGEQVDDVVDRLAGDGRVRLRSEEHTSELQSRENLVCRLLLEK